MGLSSSKYASGGTLKGAFAPPLPNVVLPQRLDPTIKKYSLTVPHDKGPGDKMVVHIKGRDVSVTIPQTKKLDTGKVRPIQSGDKFIFEWGDRELVIASTMPSLPGTVVVEAKPIIFATASLAFHSARYNDRTCIYLFWFLLFVFWF